MEEGTQPIQEGTQPILVGTQPIQEGPQPIQVLHKCCRDEVSPAALRIITM